MAYNKRHTLQWYNLNNDENSSSNTMYVTLRKSTNKIILHHHKRDIQESSLEHGTAEMYDARLPFLSSVLGNNSCMEKDDLKVLGISEKM